MTTGIKSDLTVPRDISFGMLDMEDLEYISIPDDIKEIEYGKNESKLVSYQNMRVTNSVEYFEKFTNLIHFEEAANLRSLRELNLYSVDLEMVSCKDQTYKIASIDEGWIKACKENKIDHFESDLWTIIPMAASLWEKSSKRKRKLEKSK